MRIHVVLLLLVSALAGTHALFKGEVFTYKDMPQTMSPRFTIHLTKVATVPKMLSMNTMCQVPEFQMRNFSARTGLPLTNIGGAILAKRGLQELKLNYNCDTVQYCDNGGTAGATWACLGKNRDLATADCMNNLANELHAQQYKYNMELAAKSEEIARAAVRTGLEGVKAATQEAISAASSMLDASITGMQDMLEATITSTSKANTEMLTETANDVAKKTSALLGELQEAGIRQAQNSQLQLAALSTLQSNNAASLTKSIQDVAMVASHRMHNLSMYVDSVVRGMNVNNRGSYDNVVEVSKLIQQLAAKVEKVARYELQGVDISSLLLLWGEKNTSDVFQDMPTSTYKYYASGLFGHTPSKDGENNDYRMFTELEGAPVYRCYEKGKPGPAPVYTTQTTTVDVEVRDCTTMADPEVQNILTQGPAFVVGKFRAASCSAAIISMINDIQVSYTSMSYTTFCTSTSGTAVAGKYTIAYKVAGQQDVTLTLDGTTCSVTTGSATPYTPLVAQTQVDDIHGPRFFYALGRNMQLDREATRGSTVYTNFWTTGYLAISSYNKASGTYTTVAGGVSYKVVHTYTHMPRGMPSTKYGKDAVITHPLYGIMTIHHCELAKSNAIGQSAQLEWEGVTLGYANYQGGLGVSTTASARTTYADVSGMTDTVVELLTNSTSGKFMDGISYAYTTTIWCCDVMNRPVISANTEAECNVGIYRVCPKATFGWCPLSSGNTLKGLTETVGGNCIYGGNPQVGMPTEVRYKSPRIYFCSAGSIKHASPYGVPLEPCIKSEVMLPGAGVEIQTGTISPEGMYPAACIYYNSVQERVPMYTISALFTKQTVPTMIANLHGRKVLYRQQAGGIIDEMDKLYGIGNSGYDCVTYEMDKFLHQPRSCLNYDIPEYPLDSYFAGKIRTTGLSRLLDYFDVIPSPGATPDTLTVDFVLKDGIDYEAAYINNMNTCPRISVSYEDSPQLCRLSGWPANVSLSGNITIGGQPVCDTQGTCVTDLTAADGATTDVYIDDEGDKVLCNRFLCRASVKSFIAYPVDLFSMNIRRPNLPNFLVAQNTMNYGTEIQRVLSTVQQTLTESIGTVDIPTTTGQRVNVTIVAKVDAPDLTALLADVRDKFDGTRQLADDLFGALAKRDLERWANASKYMDDFITTKYAELRENLTRIYNESLVPVGPPTGQNNNLGTYDTTTNVLLYVALAALGATWLVVGIVVLSNKGKLQAFDKYMSKALKPKSTPKEKTSYDVEMQTEAVYPPPAPEVTPDDEVEDDDDVPPPPPPEEDE